MGRVIGFVGLSHLGVVSSIAAASKGQRVIAHDPQAAVCRALSEGELPIHEPGLAEMLAEHRDNIGFTADAADLRACDMVIFSRDIPTTDANESNLDALTELIEATLPSISPSATIVVLSQVRPGYTRRLLERVRAVPGHEAATVHYQVETLVFGRAVERATEPERFIIGCENPAAPLSPAFAEYLEAFGCPILPMRYESAELAKTAINLFLVASVSTTNTLAGICEGIGADWSEIAPSLRLDRRIGPHAYLSPGLGLSGGNLERDLVTLKSLAAEAGTDAGVIDAYVGSSVYRRDWVLRQLHAGLATCDSPKVAVWGLAYKQDTKSTKNSPSLALIENLRGHRVSIFDPQATFPQGTPRHAAICDSPLDACDDADALVVMTPWAEFKQVEISAVAGRLSGRLVLDPLRCLDGSACTEAGLDYQTLGTCPPSRRAA